MNIILFDTESRKKLFPLTLTRAVADIRMGICTVQERWQKLTNAHIYVLTDEYLQSLYKQVVTGEYIFIDAGIIPNTVLVKKIISLNPGEALSDKYGVIAGRSYIASLQSLNDVAKIFERSASVPPVQRLQLPQQIFQWNEDLLRFDFEMMTRTRMSAKINNNVCVINPSQVFIEEDASVHYSSLNASDGPIYVGKDAVVMEGCLIRGPFSLGEGAVLKMGTKVYGATTVGPYCTVGGELKNSVITGYSNKAHDGYLGDSVIGEWCNFGAGTSNSNVKNTGSEVKLWNYESHDYVAAGKKCGVIMGDYSRTAINSSINTGAMIGVCCNYFAAGLSPKFIPDFTWGTTERYQFDKAVADISNWKKMKNKTLGEAETNILKHIFETL